MLLQLTDDDILLEDAQSATATTLASRPDHVAPDMWRREQLDLVTNLNTHLTKLFLAACNAPDARSPFEVEVAEYIESTGTTYVVMMRNRSLPHSLLDDPAPGLHHTYRFASRDRAVHEACDLSKFLGIVPREICQCILCEEIK